MIYNKFFHVFITYSYLSNSVWMKIQEDLEEHCHFWWDGAREREVGERWSAIVHLVVDRNFSLTFVFSKPRTLDDLKAAIHLEIELVTEETQDRARRGFGLRLKTASRVMSDGVIRSTVILNFY